MGTLEELLKRKIKIIKILYKLAIRFKKIILAFYSSGLILYIERREKMLNELKRIDTELEKLILINKKNTPNIANIIADINLLFDELIKVEKENEIILNKTLELKSGNYIENYKKFYK